LASQSKDERRLQLAAYRLGEMVEVNGREAEEVVAAEPPDGRHAFLPPLLPFSSVQRLWRRSGISSPGGGAAALYRDFLVSCVGLGPGRRPGLEKLLVVNCGEGLEPSDQRVAAQIVVGKGSAE
jgi:hypothetical protein